MPRIRLALALHNHQPTGNFGSVFEQAYAESYLPFLELVEGYSKIRFSLHTSGCLMDWLVAQRPDYVERVRALVERGQVEIVGGGYYEPILSMIPSRDRRGQIRGYSEFLYDLFGRKPRGMWTPERVWEQCLVSDIAAAGIDYTVLDDYHFRKAGLKAEQLHGYFLTEDQGRLLRVFPGSEPLRYLIPFRPVEKVIDYLREIGERYPDSLAVFADDGEKFGSWPETHKHVYEDGWLRQFFDALGENVEWIRLCTLSEALDAVDPLGQIYLPDCSYREMTEWALPPERMLAYERLWQKLDHLPDGAEIKAFMQGGYWRNFKSKYPESQEMYARMMQVSEQLDRLCDEDPEAIGDPLVHQARQELYRGQCNCAYWHGSFGGLYLPHLRNAVYSALIGSENHLLAYREGPGASFVRTQSGDLNFDGRPETRIENDRVVAFFAPERGGRLYELDLRSVGVNLGASLSRRPESYHEKVRSAANGQGDGNHERIVLKHEGLDEKLVYDAYPRQSLIDHFFPDEVSLREFDAGRAPELGDFVLGRYREELSCDERQATLRLSRFGAVDGAGATVCKTVTLEKGADDLRIAYRLHRESAERPIRFAVEFNFAALAAGADDRFFHRDGERLGRLESVLELESTGLFGLTDQWLGVDVALRFSKPSGIWTCPVQSVSQSEGGFELVHQSACVVAHWRIPREVAVWEVEVGLALASLGAEARSAPVVS